MRFARTVETTDPGGGLFGPIQVTEESTKNFPKALGVLTLAYEGLQLEPQRPQFLRRHCVLHDRHAVVEKFEALWVSCEKFAQVHVFISPSSALMGTAK